MKRLKLEVVVDVADDVEVTDVAEELEETLLHFVPSDWPDEPPVLEVK